MEHFQNSSNISVNDLDAETTSKLRGDAIGDTLYSQSFVLKTLLKFSDIEWSEELEENLCFLWDMTIEKDVCKYLFHVSFPTIACSAVSKCTDNRFIEIVIGILANILSADCNKNITEEEINVILQELNTNDPLILIQIARFIIAVAHVSEELPFISKDVLDKIEFILYNSRNDELLLKSLEVISKLTTNFKLNRNLVNIEIIKSSLSAYHSLMNSDDEILLDTKDKQLICRYMLEIVSNVCAYVYKFEDEKILVELKKSSDILINEVVKILDYFSFEENLLPVTDEFLFYMTVFQFIFEILCVNYRSELFFPLTRIFHIIHNIKDVMEELFNTILALEFFLCSQSNTNDLFRDLNKLPIGNVRQLLIVMNENKHKYDCELDLVHLLHNF